MSFLALAEESRIYSILSLLDSSPANGSAPLTIKGEVRLVLSEVEGMTQETFHGFSTDSLVRFKI
jgi:hypothetical protein